ncbi:MAG: beta-agarase, partial [Gemmatimonadales bacterium]|nr:beta-agarase [Gemmatimonadales bacterium]
EAWGSDHESWEKLLESRDPPDEERAKADLLAFNERMVEEYFRVVRNTVKQAAPKNLYLGPRFAWMNPMVVLIAARYCDVLSFNLYRGDVRGFEL